MKPLGEIDQQTYTVGIIGDGIHSAAMALESVKRGYQTILISPDDIVSRAPLPIQVKTNIHLSKLERLALFDLYRSAKEQNKLARLAANQITPMEYFVAPNPKVRSESKVRIGMRLLQRINGASRCSPTEEAQAAVKSPIPSNHCYKEILINESRLTIETTLAAVELGTTFLPHCQIKTAERRRNDWRLHLEQKTPHPQTDKAIICQNLINCTGSQASHYIEQILHSHSRCKVKPVFYGYILVNKNYRGNHGYVLQHTNGQLIHVTPIDESFLQIGPLISSQKVEPQKLCQELIDLCNANFNKVFNTDDIITHALCERAATEDPCENNATELLDSFLDLSTGQRERKAPLLTLFGYNLTYHRLLSAKALDILGPFLPAKAMQYSKSDFLPGSRVKNVLTDLEQSYPRLDPLTLKYFAQQYGARAADVLGEANTTESLGHFFGGHIYQKELDYMLTHEWVSNTDDFYRRLPAHLLYKGNIHRDAIENYLDTQLK